MIPTGFKPMLAGKFEAQRQRYPVYLQPKYDGIRCTIFDGMGFSRTMKPIPNVYIQTWIWSFKDYLEAFDGELIVGPPTAEDVYRKTMSGVMSEGGEPNFAFYSFDQAIDGEYRVRIRQLHNAHVRIGQSDEYALIDRVVPVPTVECPDELTLYEHESTFLAAGYEGAIIRGMSNHYKFGRSTAVEGGLLKLKRFIDEEAEIIAFQELLHNENEATLDAFGRTKRSSHQDNKVPGNKLGALVVRNKCGQEFNVGTGFDQALRQKIWDNRDRYLGKIITYRYVKVGGYDLPRFPVFHGFRDSRDIS